MLKQLIESLTQLPRLSDKFLEIEQRAAKAPITVEDIYELIRLANYETDENEFPNLNQEQVLLELSECRQLLINTDDYYYI